MLGSELGLVYLKLDVVHDLFLLALVEDAQTIVQLSHF